MKRKLFAAAALCLVLLTGCSAVADFRVNRQLDLGEKYLIEEEYDKAMLAYSKALDIEPKEMEAYRGLSDVFTAQKDLESSVNVLKKALAVADDLSPQKGCQNEHGNPGDEYKDRHTVNGFRRRGL